MRYARLLRREKNIAASDTGGVLERWAFGRDLLTDPAKTTPAGNLKHGVLAELIGRAAAGGYKLTEQEIQRRLRAARTYPSEAQIREALTDFANWDALARAGFPPVEAPPDTLPFDPRDSGERARDAAREFTRHANGSGSEQLTLFDFFPDDKFTELSTLGELMKYAHEMAELTERYARKDRERAAYLDSLIAAVHGDLSKTWEEAQAALDGAA
ncbi:MAG TPA: hypothetical protein VFB06_11105 [Streptosporangiaceae bacterium]|nr:hypothetical protein [Streptosporangiaceae bacterium]